MLAYTILLGVLGATGVAYGHGTGSETLPPIELDGQLVTIVVSSELDNGMVRVDMSLVRLSTGESIPDVDFEITARHGRTHLFTQEFHQNDGSIIFELVEGASYTAPESIGGGFFGILGPGSFRVAGPGLTGGGLYSFDIVLRSVDGHTPDPAPIFESAVSVPITYQDAIHDERWGEQVMQFITYYDTLHDRGYDPQTGRVYFAMPFQWDADIIQLIETVHVEFTIPGAFGDLLVSEMVVYVNGILAPDRVVTIDDYITDFRTVHIVLPRTLLLDMLDGIVGDTMKFDVGAKLQTPYSAVTANGEYRMIVDVVPARLVAGQEAVISFNVTSVFLRSLNAEVPYTATVTHQDAMLYTHSGVSGVGSRMQFPIPEDISGVALVSFQDINGNELADATLPVFIDPARKESVPPWVRETVGLWTSGMIDDETFAAAISYMIQQEVILIGGISGMEGDGGPIDDWVRTTAGWWVDGLVSDAEFLAGIQYLVERGIIIV